MQRFVNVSHTVTAPAVRSAEDMCKKTVFIMFEIWAYLQTNDIN
jgi:hypothetical protein